jgi:predicted cupin superfamily sugar epimerase
MRMLTAAEMIQSLNSGHTPKAVITGKLFAIRGWWKAGPLPPQPWHYYAGAALRLSLVDGSKEEIFRLGGDVRAGEVPQVTVPARAWQAAETLGEWTLVGCTVAPSFSFGGFELAPAGWSPQHK